MNYRAMQLTIPLACLMSLAGCERKTIEPSAVAASTASVAPLSTAPVDDSATVPATAPSAAPVTMLTFEHKDTGLHAQYPSTWKSVKDKDYELKLVPADGSSGRQITIDVPDLPPHFPGMIRLGLIENGFVKDLKSQHKDVHIERSEDHPANGGAKCRLVESSWTEGGKPRKQMALLMMRKEHVYILAYECNAADAPAVQADFDKIAASLSWTK